MYHQHSLTLPSYILKLSLLLACSIFGNHLYASNGPDGSHSINANAQNSSYATETLSQQAGATSEETDIDWIKENASSPLDHTKPRPKKNVFMEKWEMISKVGKRTTVMATIGGALIAIGASCKVYKNYFTKEKKATTTSLAATSLYKNGLLFMLCLLIALLLMAGIFYRKKKRA